MTIHNSSESTVDMHSISISELIDILTALADTLENTNLSLEPRFMKVGEGLQSVFFDSNGLEQTALKAAELVNKDSESSALRNIDKRAHKTIARLQRHQESASRSLETVQSVIGHLQQLRPKNKTLLKIAKHLRAISICFAVESSRSYESLEMFAAFTQKMNSLVDDIFEITDNIRSDSRLAEEKQCAALNQISVGSDSLHMLLQKADNAITGASDRIDRIVCLSVAALEQAGSQSKEVARHISSIVTAMQFHDITRQQIEHIVSTLRHEVMVLHELSAGADADVDNELAAISHIYSVLGIQIAQLRQVMAYIQKAHQAIESSFVEIGKASGKLAESTSAIGTGEVENNPFRNLIAALEDLNQLFEYGQQQDNHISEAAEHASEASIILSHHAQEILEINTDIGIQALNAIINSVHLQKDGRVLATLAKEVTQLSGKCSGVAQNIVESLETITAITKQADISANDYVDDSADIDLEPGIRQITEAFGDFNKRSLSATDQAHQLQTSILEIKAGLEFLYEVEDRLCALTNDMKSLQEKLQPANESAASAGVDSIGDYADGYTMKSEREVHESFLNRSTSCEHISDSSVSVLPVMLFEEPDNDLGDNVELF